jgi:hypothetical protein
MTHKIADLKDGERMSSRIALKQRASARTGQNPAEEAHVAWVYLIGLALALWAGCGGVIGVGRRLWSIDTTLRIHLVAAPILAFLVASLHKGLAPAFDPMLRAASITTIVVLLDALVVAPFFERSYAMFRSVIGTWLPFVAIFAASLAAGVLALG